LAIAWNEDDPRDAVALVQNLTRLLHLIADQAHLRQLPTISMAQEWHRRIYAGIKLPVPYHAGGIRDSDTNLPELYGYEVRIGAQSGVDSRLLTANGSASILSPMETAEPLVFGRIGARCAIAFRHL
jgi:hypothetical protein